MQWENVRVLKLGDDLDFVEKAVSPYCLGKLRVEYFDGDTTVMPRVLCKVDHGHAAAAELPLDHVPVAQGLGQLGRDSLDQVRSCEVGGTLRICAGAPFELVQR
jgi:hypothetical protein